MTTTHPKLSIIVPNYNHGALLEESVSSVAEADYPSMEIIIIDDASTDNSLEVIAKLRSKYPIIRLIQHSENQGVNPTANEGTLLSKGEYLHYLGADDIRYPGFIEKTISLLEKHPEIPLGCSDGIFTWPEEPGKRTQERLILTETPLIIKPKLVPKLLKRSNFWIQGQTVVIRRSALLRYSEYDNKLGGLSDWYLFHQIALHEGIAYLPEALAELRVSSSTFSGGFREESLRECYRYLFKLLEADPQTSKGFRKACLLRKMVKGLYPELIKDPKMWKYILPLKIQNITKFFEKHTPFKLNTYRLNKLLPKLQPTPDP